MRASSPGVGSPVIDCGSRRVHAGGVSATAVRRGLIARTETALMVSLMHLLLHVSGNCVDCQPFLRDVADIEDLFTLQRPALLVEGRQHARCTVGVLQRYAADLGQ